MGQDAATLDDPALTVDQLAKLLQLNRNTVYNLVKAGEIPGATRFGRVIRVHGPTVVAWLAKGQTHVSRDARRRAAK